MTQVCVGNLGRTSAFRPKNFSKSYLLRCHAQIEHHMFNVQLFEQCFVRNSSLSPPCSSFTPHSRSPSSTHLFGPMPTTSSPLAQHLGVSLKMQFSLASPLAPPVPLFSPLSPSPSPPLISRLLSISISLGLTHPPSRFESESQSPSLSLCIPSPLILLTRGVLCSSCPPSRVTLQPLHHPHSPQAFTHVHACAAAQAN